MQVYQWWVLKDTGELLARFNWPRSKPIHVVKNGYMYTKEKIRIQAWKRLWNAGLKWNRLEKYECYKLIDVSIQVLEN